MLRMLRALDEQRRNGGGLALSEVPAAIRENQRHFRRQEINRLIAEIRFLRKKIDFYDIPLPKHLAEMPKRANHDYVIHHREVEKYRMLNDHSQLAGKNFRKYKRALEKECQLDEIKDSTREVDRLKAVLGEK